MTDPVRTSENFLVFGSPAIEQSEIAEVVRTMESGWLGTGPRVAEFEEAVKAYSGAKYAIAVNSCTAALHLSLVAMNLEPGDEVITTPLTFCATVNAIIHAGGTPVLSDIDPETLNLAPYELERWITPRTRAVLPVHFAGRPCDMEVLKHISDKHGLRLIEDCAHAIETEYRGKRAGTFGDFGCLSFYVTKNVVTGEGGMVLTNDRESAERIRVLSLHGMSRDAWKRFGKSGYKHYQVIEAGFKYNMMDLQAAIGIHQLARVEDYWKIRHRHWDTYNMKLANLPIGLPADPHPEDRHALHLYTVLVDEERCDVSRDEFLESMTQEGIGVGVHYLSIPEHPYYRKRFGWNPEDYPNATRVGRQIVSLPLSAKLDSRDVGDVVEAVSRVLSG